MAHDPVRRLVAHRHIEVQRVVGPVEIADHDLVLCKAAVPPEVVDQHNGQRLPPGGYAQPGLHVGHVRLDLVGQIPCDLLVDAARDRLLDERAELYGRFLATCAGCHQLMGKGGPQ